MANGSEVKARMVSAGEDLLSHRGYGVTMLEVIERADAPRGSIYYHFPNGKSELAIEVARKVRAEIEIFVARTSAKIPETGQFLARLVEHHRKRLVNSDYVLGCPLMGVIASGEMDAKLAVAVEEAFETWTSTIAVALGGRGFTPADAAQLASLMVAGIEGCIVLGRATRSPQPFHDFARSIPLLVAGVLAQQSV